MIRQLRTWSSIGVAILYMACMIGQVQALTNAELVILKAFIAADPTLNTIPNTPDGNFTIAQSMNQLAAVDCWAWRTNVSKQEIVSTVSGEATSFIWVGNGFITRSAGEQAAWRELFSDSGTVNAALPNVRQAFQDIFSGTGNAASNRAHLLVVSRRKTTVAEKLYATGACSTASPSTMTFEGLLTYQDVTAARDLP